MRVGVADVAKPTSGDFVIVGGGHGRELLDIVDEMEIRHRFLGFVDDSELDPTALQRIARRGAELIGNVGWLGASASIDYTVGIGSSAVRRRIDELLSNGPNRREPLVLVHPTSSIGSETVLSPGVVLGARSTLTTNVAIGRHSHVNVGCAIQHDTTIGAYVTVSPGVTINGDVVIEDDVFIGSGAVITRGCSIGVGAVIGAGAVVLDDVSPGSRSFGIPARPRFS